MMEPHRPLLSDLKPSSSREGGPLIFKWHQNQEEGIRKKSALSRDRSLGESASSAGDRSSAPADSVDVKAKAHHNCDHEDRFFTYSDDEMSSLEQWGGDHRDAQPPVSTDEQEKHLLLQSHQHRTKSHRRCRQSVAENPNLQEAAAAGRYDEGRYGSFGMGVSGCAGRPGSELCLSSPPLRPGRRHCRLAEEERVARALPSHTTSPVMESESCHSSCKADLFSPSLSSRRREDRNEKTKQRSLARKKKTKKKTLEQSSNTPPPEKRQQEEEDSQDPSPSLSSPFPHSLTPGEKSSLPKRPQQLRYDKRQNDASNKVLLSTAAPKYPTQALRRGNHSNSNSPPPQADFFSPSTSHKYSNNGDERQRTKPRQKKMPRARRSQSDHYISAETQKRSSHGDRQKTEGINMDNASNSPLPSEEDKIEVEAFKHRTYRRRLVDKVFGALFIVQFVVVSFVGIAYAPDVLMLDEGEGGSDIQSKNERDLVDLVNSWYSPTYERRWLRWSGHHGGQVKDASGQQSSDFQDEKVDIFDVDTGRKFIRSNSPLLSTEENELLIKNIDSESKGTNDGTRHYDEYAPHIGRNKTAQQEEQNGLTEGILLVDDASFSRKADYYNAIILCCITGTYATFLSVLTIGFMLILAKSLIPVSLVFTVVTSLAWGSVGFALSPRGSGGVLPILGILAFALSFGYTIVVWDRIPFAATNLNTALCGMQCTADITLTGLVMLIVAFLWCMIWSVAFIGLHERTHNGCDNINGNGVIECPGEKWWPVYCVGLFLSFYWTYQVIKNIVQVTVARAVSTWWFHPESVKPCCSGSVRTPFLQAMTTSLGSICFGSLLVRPAAELSRIIRLTCVPSPKERERRSSSSHSKQNSGFDEESPLTGGQTSVGYIVAQVQAFADRCATELDRNFSRWSLTYVGLHGYSFLDAGEKATDLFERREWSSVVADDLIHNVLLMACMVIGGSTGCFGLLVEEVDGYTFTSFADPVVTAFLIGTITGIVLSTVLLSVVGSSVNTVLVCYAEGLNEFSKNHPQLSEEMRCSWSQI